MKIDFSVVSLSFREIEPRPQEYAGRAFSVNLTFWENGRPAPNDCYFAVGYKKAPGGDYLDVSRPMCLTGELWEIPGASAYCFASGEFWEKSDVPAEYAKAASLWGSLVITLELVLRNILFEDTGGVGLVMFDTRPGRAALVEDLRRWAECVREQSENTNSRPAVYLKTPRKLSADTRGRLREMSFYGDAGAGKVIILESGLELVAAHNVGRTGSVSVVCEPAPGLYSFIERIQKWIRRAWRRQR